MKKLWALALFLLSAGAWATVEVNPFAAGTGGGVSAVTGTPPVASSGGATPAISMSTATSGVDGYLTSTDWTTFNAKQPAGSYAVTTRTISTTAPITGGGDLSTNRTFAIAAATNSVPGYLTSADHTTFAAKAASGANADITSLSTIGQDGIIWEDAGSNTVQVLAPVTLNDSYQLFWPVTGQAIPSNSVLSYTAGGQLAWASPGASTATVLNYLANNVSAKTAAFAYSDSNLALTGNPGTIDGVDLSFGGTILLNAQTDPTENGLWTVITGGAWYREPITFPDNTISCFGAIVPVENGGIVYGNTLWFSTCDGSGTVHFVQIPTTGVTTKTISKMGACTVASTTLSTTATDETCAGVPASAAVSVTCSGQAAFTTPTAGGLYCRAKGTANTIICNTVVANAVAMAYSCSWVQP